MMILEGIRVVEVGWIFAASPQKVPRWDLGRVEYDLNLTEGLK